MIRYALLLALVFFVLGLLRMARPLFFGGRARRRAVPRREEAEMVRDPVCGTWIDRRLALSVPRAEGGAVAVCSENCRKRLEAG